MWCGKFCPSECIRRNLKIVMIALSVISAVMSVTSLVIAVTHIYAEDGENIKLGDMRNWTANENSSTKMHERQKRGANDLYDLYCPWGGKDLKLYGWEIEQEKTLEEFDDYCQCQHKDMCKVDQYHPNLFCSSRIMQSLMENDQKVKHACVIHDICYKTERTKEKCDREFIHNYKMLCQGSHLGRTISAGLGAGAGAAAGAGAIAGAVIGCAIPFINIFACPAAIAGATVGTTVIATGAAAGAIAGSTSDCNTASIIIKETLAHHGHTNSEYNCDLCAGSAAEVHVDLSLTRLGSGHPAHGKYTLNRGDKNWGFRPVYKKVDGNIWLYYVPTNFGGGKWNVGQTIGSAYSYFSAKDTKNGIPTSNWKIGNRVENVKIQKKKFA